MDTYTYIRYSFDDKRRMKMEYAGDSEKLARRRRYRPTKDETVVLELWKNGEWVWSITNFHNKLIQEINAINEAKLNEGN